VVLGNQVGRRGPPPGPYCAGARTPAGSSAPPLPGPAIVTVPQPQRRCSIRSSTQTSAIAGRSATCRTFVELTAADRNDREQPRQPRGRCTSTSSGSATRANVLPDEPG